MASEAYEQVKAAIDIVDLIGERVKLRLAGQIYRGLCPFHNEKTASFYVYPETQSYYCFGCHEGGNVFSYVMKTEGLEFKEALELLAERAGIVLKTHEHNTGSKTIYDLFELSSKFFTSTLLGERGRAARAYMKNRKLDISDIEEFSLGYSSSSWSSLTDYLSKQGISDDQMLKAGLVSKSKHGLFDRFRGRLIFPIRSITGKIIAFGGRLIDGEGAKYINSSENEVFSKRKTLYLINEARKFIREKKRSILVEGYMDALRLHKAGFRESVASLGTSLTSEQAEILSHFADRCYICYDSDNAGKEATLRGMYTLQQKGLDVYVVSIPTGKDPDEFLSSNPPEKFEEALTNAKPLILAHIDFLKPILNDPAKRKTAINELINGLKTLNSEDVLQYKMQISEATLISPLELEERIFGTMDQVHIHNTPNVFNNFNMDQLYLLEAGLCALLMENRECRLKFEPIEIYNILNDSNAQNTAYAILTGNPDTLPEFWLSIGDTEKINLIATGKNFCSQIGNVQDSEKWEKIYKDLKSKKVIQRIHEINIKMQQNKATNEDLKELQDLQQQKELLIK